MLDNGGIKWEMRRNSMSVLRVYAEDNSAEFEEFSEFDEISRRMRLAGIQFERWVADQELPGNASQEEILKAYEGPVSKLMRDRGFVTADVISVQPDTPNTPELRKKFLNEHTHGEDEARFFVDGSGLFYIHTGGKVYGLLCERGDFIDIPPRTKHWFDMGPRPLLKCIRTFTTPEGWVADFTGSDIASRFPRFEVLIPEPV
jgi:1,2-dihydroxy-3-keto-5-methylthiopentene dioxygenase